MFLRNVPLGTSACAYVEVMVRDDCHQDSHQPLIVCEGGLVLLFAVVY